MSDEVPKEDPAEPTTQQWVNLQMMEYVRHLAEYAVANSTLLNKLASIEFKRLVEAGETEEALSLQKSGKEIHRRGLLFHNAAVDLWEAFKADSGDALRPTQPDPVKVVVEDEDYE